MSKQFSISPRAVPSWTLRVSVPFAALVAAAIIGGSILALSGSNPLEAYRTMVDASFNGLRPATRTLTLATPLILTGLAAAVAFRMKIWNIGAEGQLYIGAVTASGLALALPTSTPRSITIAILLIGGIAAGAVWAGLAAIPKAYFSADEVITTLMLNFVALSFMNYLIFGTVSYWRNPETRYPEGLQIPENAKLPMISYRLHYGIVIAILAAILIWWILRRTTYGFELRTIGDSQEASRYAGMRVNTKILSVLALSGALAGGAGAIEVSGVVGRLDPHALSTHELGFTGIVVAAVARLNCMTVIPVAVLLAALMTSGSSLQRVLGIQPEIVFFLQGLIFLFVAAGEFFLANKVNITTKAPTRLEVDGGLTGE
ncbi:MAG: ABC transporter permease [Acidimicrobiales bacterium]|jgi:simple sugar transport system permease protein|nr:ABC transporter permease [Chloroflexota bacterium]MDP6076749.1 ABC transporter permease [Acidimicrobiales bacterium]|tara:strand:+ start:2679 stop:3797 length:1119 start_codon:yes stop_codon:yes gene_type:complete